MELHIMRLYILVILIRLFISWKGNSGVMIAPPDTPYEILKEKIIVVP